MLFKMGDIIRFDRKDKCTKSMVGAGSCPCQPQSSQTPNSHPKKLNLLFQNTYNTFTGNNQMPSMGKTSSMCYINDIQLFTPPHLHLSCLCGVGAVRCMLHNAAAACFVQPLVQSFSKTASPAGAAHL